MTSSLTSSTSCHVSRAIVAGVPHPLQCCFPSCSCHFYLCLFVVFSLVFVFVIFILVFVFVLLKFGKVQWFAPCNILVVFTLALFWMEGATVAVALWRDMLYNSHAKLWARGWSLLKCFAQTAQALLDVNIPVDWDYWKGDENRTHML